MFFFPNIKNKRTYLVQFFFCVFTFNFFSCSNTVNPAQIDRNAMNSEGWYLTLGVPGKSWWTKWMWLLKEVKLSEVLWKQIQTPNENKNNFAQFVLNCIYFSLTYNNNKTFPILHCINFSHDVHSSILILLWNFFLNLKMVKTKPERNDIGSIFSWNVKGKIDQQETAIKKNLVQVFRYEVVHLPNLPSLAKKPIFISSTRNKRSKCTK